MFVIQVRVNDDRSPFQKIIDGSGNAKDWKNYHHTFKAIESAKVECESLIKSGRYQASDVRILELVCIFESSLTIQSKSMNNKT